jgi:hypothetical protein
MHGEKYVEVTGMFTLAGLNGERMKGHVDKAEDLTTNPRWPLGFVLSPWDGKILTYP